MRNVIWLMAAIWCALAGLLAAPAQAEKRVALVIGNGSYAHIAGLPNVPNDAAAMARLFKAARFDAVDVMHDLGVAELRRALKLFAGRAADADVAVVFYAGHGIEVGQVNYLIPVDARLVTDFDVEDETVPLDRVLQAMEPAKRLRLVLLDACRENPFLKSMKRTVAARSVGRGLGRIEPSTTNTLIAYATKPNAIAEDGKGPNSPFTAALVKHLLTPGLDLRIALGHVRDEVLTSTGNKQEPYVTGSLGGGIVSIAIDHGKDGADKEAPAPAAVSEIVARLQRSLKNYGCYHGSVDGIWSDDARQALALFARLNGREPENLDATIENVVQVEGGVSMGCAAVSAAPPKNAALGCAPKPGARILREPDRDKRHPDWRDDASVGTSWSLTEAQVIANSTGRYLYGKLYSPRGGYEKWVYGLAEQWDCQ